jgi:hypothetical protein
MPCVGKSWRARLPWFCACPSGYGCRKPNPATPSFGLTGVDPQAFGLQGQRALLTLGGTFSLAYPCELFRALLALAFGA